MNTWLGVLEASASNASSTDRAALGVLFLDPTRLEPSVLAKLTADGKLALPRALLASFPSVDCFSVTEEDGRIVLSPLHLSRADEVREKLEELGVTEGDVKDAVAWARRPS